MKLFTEVKKLKKICFAILAHEKKTVLQDMIENIRYFCPNSSIVLYNGGNDPRLCRNLGCPVCPDSRKMKWGNLALYMLDVMKWLNKVNFEYDYLINLDSDVLFIKKGFEKFVISEMKNTDYMAVRAKIYSDKWYPGQQMKKKWSKWQGIFHTDTFWGCFNVGQIFSRQFVHKILSFDKINKVKKNILKHGTFALEEILYVTLAQTLDVRMKAYPKDMALYIRSKPYFKHSEIKKCLKSGDRCFFIHPVRRNMNDGARKYIRSLRRKY